MFEDGGELVVKIREELSQMSNGGEETDAVEEVCCYEESKVEKNGRKLNQGVDQGREGRAKKAGKHGCDRHGVSSGLVGLAMTKIDAYVDWVVT